MFDPATLKGAVIPAEDSSQFSTWLAPEVQDGQVVQSEKLKNRGPRGELVNVNKEEVIYSRLTAAQLEEISNQAYEDVRALAEKDGFQQGRKEGYQAGVAAAEKDMQQQRDQLKAVIGDLVSYLSGQENDVERALVNIATTIAGAVVRRELQLDNQCLHEVVAEAVAALPMEPANLTVFLNEKDKQQLEKADLPAGWNINIDPTLSPGGCRVVTRQSVVDYSLEQQFGQTVEALVEDRYAQLAAADKAVLHTDSSTPAQPSNYKPES